jgi:hypothetical protein
MFISFETTVSDAEGNDLEILVEAEVFKPEPDVGSLGPIVSGLQIFNASGLQLPLSRFEPGTQDLLVEKIQDEYRVSHS